MDTSRSRPAHAPLAETPGLRKPPAYVIENDAAADGEQRRGLTFWCCVRDVANDVALELELQADAAGHAHFASVRVLRVARGQEPWRPVPWDAQDVEHGRLLSWLETDAGVQGLARRAWSAWMLAEAAE